MHRDGAFRPMLLIECGLVLIAVLVALIFPEAGSHWFKALECGFARLARRRVLAVVTVGLTALVLRAALLPILPVPHPAVHDGFSHLLAANTFADARLANPTHPMWIHFESFHIIQKPTYASMYYPAQGLFLAAGQRILRPSIWGGWPPTCLICAASCCPLQRPLA